MTRELIEDFTKIVKPFVQKRLLEENFEGMGEQDKAEFGRDFDEILSLAIKGLESSTWIPVTEKRPVEFEKVLVTYRLHYDNSIHVGIGNIIASDVNERYYWNINEQDYVGWDMLAWMPLPEPYKGRD